MKNVGGWTKEDGRKKTDSSLFLLPSSLLFPVVSALWFVVVTRSVGVYPRRLTVDRYPALSK